MIAAVETFGRAVPLPAMLVGRAHERTRLREALAALLAWRGGLVLIGGDVGIGKTALAKALAREAAERDVLVVTGHCYDRTDTPPYGLWRDLFAHWPRSATEQYAAPTTNGANNPVAWPARLAVMPPFVTGSLHAGGGDHLAIAAQVRDYLTSAATGPLCLLLDDLHWADQASLDLLRYLARGLANSPILIVATYRDQAITRQHPLYAILPILAREADPLRLHLAPLDDTAVQTLLWARYGLAPADEGRLVGALHERAEGNPLFISEILRACEEQGLLRRTEDNDRHWVLGDIGRVGVPPLLKQVIDGQIAPLGAEAGRLLAVAATLGREVTLALWAMVAEVGEDVLLDLVECAVEAHLIEETPDGTAIRFRHALIRATLYDGSPASRRRIWHRRAGEALADLAASDPGAVAEHFVQAGDPRAVLWLTRSAERALRVSDWPTAIQRFVQAVSLLRVSGDDEVARGWLLYRLGRLRRYSDVAAGLAHFAEAEEIAIARGDRALLVLMAFGRALLHISPGQVHWGLAEMEKALADWEALTPDDLAALQAQQVGPGVDPPWGTLALMLALMGRFSEARRIAERVIGGPVPAPPSNRLEDFPWADAHLALGHIHTMYGALAEASAAYEQARSAYRTAAHHHLVGLSAAHELDAVLRYGTDDLAARARLAAEAEEMLSRAHGVRGALPPRVARLPLLLLEGRWTEARNLAEMAQSRSDSRELFAATVLGILARAQGDAQTAWRIVAQQLPAGLATPPGGAIFADALALIELAVGLALDANDLPTMRSWLEVYDRWLAWGRASAGTCAGRLAWAHYYRATGDLTRARELGEAACAAASAPRQPLGLLAAERFLGDLAAATGQFDVAVVHLETALALADACAAPYERALTLLALAELHTARAAAASNGPYQTNRPDMLRAARLALDEVRAICTPLGAAPTLAQIDALTARVRALEPLGAPTPLVAAAPTPAAVVPDDPAVPAEQPAAPMPGLMLTSMPRREFLPPAGLTLREVEVLRLIAAGLSNREIAGRLFLSVRTAERHIANIYKKIGAHSKADATAFAFSCGLL